MKIILWETSLKDASLQELSRLGSPTLGARLAVQVKSMSQICPSVYDLLNCKSKINKLLNSLEEFIQKRQNSLLPQG